MTRHVGETSFHLFFRGEEICRDASLINRSRCGTPGNRSVISFVYLLDTGEDPVAGRKV